MNPGAIDHTARVGCFVAKQNASEALPQARRTNQQKSDGLYLGDFIKLLQPIRTELPSLSLATYA
jgi:hypothetical protein